MEKSSRYTGKWPIFICYRQADGQATAARIFSLLDKHVLPISGNEAVGTIGTPPFLDVYFDRAAPGVSDWTEIHEPFLKRARAFILICTPGAKLHEGSGDWVQHEIEWWLNHRDMAPILVDPLGQEARFVPDAIAQRWPNAQRVRLQEDEWNDLSEIERAVLEARTRDQFIGAIKPSGEAFYKQEFELDRARVSKLNATRQSMWALAVLLIAMIGVAGWVYSLKNQVERASEKTQVAQIAEAAARQLADTRLVESQAIRASTEARLFEYLQKSRNFEAYKPQMQDWQKGFEQRAADLMQVARAGLPKCENTDSFTIYERQLIGMELNTDNQAEMLWFYLGVILGQSPAPGDWEPSVLEVFVAPPEAMRPGRDLERASLQEQVEGAGITADRAWSFVVGLADGNYLKFLTETYRVTFQAINMHDDGDMVMRFDLCKEVPLAPDISQN